MSGMAEGIGVGLRPAVADDGPFLTEMLFEALN
jgi:hypothetical protein